MKTFTGAEEDYQGGDGDMSDMGRRELLGRHVMGGEPRRWGRRQLLQTGAVALGGAGAGWTAAAVALPAAPAPVDAVVASAGPPAGMQTVAFHGPHQAGVATPAQAGLSLVGLDLLAGVGSDDLARLMTLLSDDAARLTSGLPALADTEPELAAHPARLTATFGFGPRVMADLVRGDAGRVAPLPAFRTDRLDDAWGQTDLVVQLCADDPLTLAHARRMILKDAAAFARVRWIQDGYREARGTVPDGTTMRNVMGQVDGTANPAEADPDFADLIWSRQPGFEGGTFLAVRRIRARLDTWDKVDRASREAVVGRRLDNGAPLTGGPRARPARPRGHRRARPPGHRPGQPRRPRPQQRPRPAVPAPRLQLHRRRPPPGHRRGLRPGVPRLRRRPRASVRPGAATAGRARPAQPVGDHDRVRRVRRPTRRAPRAIRRPFAVRRVREATCAGSCSPSAPCSSVPCSSARRWHPPRRGRTPAWWRPRRPTVTGWTRLPGEVVLEFSDDISAPAYVVVTAPDGSRPATGPAEVDGTVVTQTLTAGTAGTATGPYTIAYRAVSVDGHTITGEIGFEVTGAGGQQTPEAGEPATGAPTAAPGSAPGTTSRRGARGRLAPRPRRGRGRRALRRVRPSPAAGPAGRRGRYSCSSSSIVTSSPMRVIRVPSRVTSKPSVKACVSHWSWLISSSEQAIIVDAGWPLQASTPSLTAYAELMVLQSAETAIVPSSKATRSVEPSTSSCPLTSVDVYVVPSRSSGTGTVARPRRRSRTRPGPAPPRRPHRPRRHL